MTGDLEDRRVGGTSVMSCRGLEGICDTLCSDVMYVSIGIQMYILGTYVPRERLKHSKVDIYYIFRFQGQIVNKDSMYDLESIPSRIRCW